MPHAPALPQVSVPARKHADPATGTEAIAASRRSGPPSMIARGAAVLPISAGNTARQLQSMRDSGTTVPVARPSYVLNVGEVLQKRRIPVGALRLRLGLFGAEACSEPMRAQMERIEARYKIILERRGSLDTFEVHVKVSEALFSGWMDALHAVEKQVAERLRSALLVRPKVKLVEPGRLERAEGKVWHVIDKRPSRTGWGADGVRGAAGGASPRFAPPALVQSGWKTLSQSSSGLLLCVSGDRAATE